MASSDPGFQISKTKTDSHQAIWVEYQNNKIAEILYRGATLNFLSLSGQPVIAGYDLASQQPFVGAKSAILFPFPNRIDTGSFQFNGNHYQFPINEPGRQNAIHGFLMDMDFQLVEEQVAEEETIVVMGCMYDGKLPYFPFPFYFTVQYSFSNESFAVDFAIQNTGQASMPMGLGWHPYFTLGGRADDWLLHLPASKQVMVDERMIPTGNSEKLEDFQQPAIIGPRQLDTCFQCDSAGFSIALTNPQRSQTLQVTFDTSAGYYQLYIPPDRGSLAIEPMSCSINAFNNRNGLEVLAPERSFSMRGKVTIKTG
ncbi:MAG: hypothetical protein OEY56_15085 [Cyclobacteriaceae bacterium]|nr:hypothetical protein [Cyclobacteriaceae bacterium]